MIGLIKRLWAAAPLATAILALALAATLVFGVRSAVFWADRERVTREQPVAGWMTPGYVAHSWHVPRDVIAEALALDADRKPQRKTLSAIAEARGVPVEEIIAALEAAIAAHRAAHPEPSAKDGGDVGGEAGDDDATGDATDDGEGNGG